MVDLVQRLPVAEQSSQIGDFLLELADARRFLLELFSEDHALGLGLAL